jgi:hypothetical protein
MRPSQDVDKYESAEKGTAYELATYRQQRDALYRKALEAGSKKIVGAASYYAAEARELNRQIRDMQHSMQMELFIKANKVIFP